MQTCSRPLLRPVALTILTLSLLAGRATLAQNIPTPESSLGFQPGADYHLATYDESVAYLSRK